MKKACHTEPFNSHSFGGKIQHHEKLGGMYPSGLNFVKYYILKTTQVPIRVKGTQQSAVWG